jgi:hypothetical protein
MPRQRFLERAQVFASKSIGVATRQISGRANAPQDAMMNGGFRMNLQKLTKVFGFTLAIATVAAMFCQAALAQGPVPDAPQPVVETSFVTDSPAPRLPAQHRFWDKENLTLFTANTALTMTDFSVTRANLANGGQELNPIVRVFGRSSAGLAVNFAGEAAGVVGLSYFFHKTGHHRLERMTSSINIGASAGAVAYGLTHR